MTYYVLFVVHLATRRVEIAGVTRYPDSAWMRQVARNLTMADVGFLNGYKYLIHDRDGKFMPGFSELLETGGTKSLRLPRRSPNLNAIAERFVRSVKEECLDRLILFGESSLWRAVNEYIPHYHRERNHQGLENRLLFPWDEDLRPEGRIGSRERLGGLLKFYRRAA